MKWGRTCGVGHPQGTGAEAPHSKEPRMISGKDGAAEPRRAAGGCPGFMARKTHEGQFGNKMSLVGPLHTALL